MIHLDWYIKLKSIKNFITLFGVIFTSLTCTGARPNNLGVKGNRLLDCPNKPNCVSSQSSMSDSHYIEPLKYNKDLPIAFLELKQLIEKQEGAKVISATDTYLYAEFTSRIMRFVDDVEFYFVDSDKIIHVRSASRLGKSDLGVNRKRIEQIRNQVNF